jgi:type II secretory pathway component PulF
MLLAILAPFVTQILYQTSSFSSDEKYNELCYVVVLVFMEMLYLDSNNASADYVLIRLYLCSKYKLYNDPLLGCCF